MPRTIEFASMTIDEGWFAWTEDETNPLAKRLDRKRSLMLQGLRAAGPALVAAGDPAGENVNTLLGFFGIGESLAVSSRETRDLAKGFATELRYLKPKCPPIVVPGVEGVRIFVLGPPEDESFLMRARPSSKPGEVYHESDDHALGVDGALSMALLAAAGSDLEPGDAWLAETAQPFAGNHRLPAHIVEARPNDYQFFHDHYGFQPEESEPWRRINSDWQASAESLALKLDAATNNTSLVLAIELRSTGRVLLFAADAQVGNWQSWHEGGWSTDNGLDQGEDPILARDLLARTVLYKVGHHGSHNATLRAQGLELMTSAELTAMIPVDEEWAHARRPHPWRMPFGPLYEELLARTRGAHRAGRRRTRRAGLPYTGLGRVQRQSQRRGQSVRRG